MKKYERIAQDLEKKIVDKVYQSNELIPSENELVELYGVSRATIRQALSILEENGWIQKKHGLGSMVIPREKLNFPISGLTSYRELQHQLGFDSFTDVVIFEKILVSEALSALTDFPVGSEAYHILRRRQIDGIYSVLDRDYIWANVAPELTKEIAQVSIYQYLEEVLHLEIAYAQKEITVDFANDEDRDLLDLDSQDRHIVSVKSHVFLSDNTPFQYTESRHQVDKFRFNEFARRQKK